MEMEHDTAVLNTMLDLEPPFIKTSSYAYDASVCWLIEELTLQHQQEKQVLELLHTQEHGSCQIQNENFGGCLSHSLVVDVHMPH